MNFSILFIPLNREFSNLFSRANALCLLVDGSTRKRGLSVNYPNSEGMVYQVEAVEKCIRDGLLECPDARHRLRLRTVQKEGIALFF